MDEALEPEINRRKIRVGLALIVVVLVVSLVMVAVIEAPAGKAFMLAVALSAFVRAFLLTRSLRAGG